jgi:hypothetical protein
MTLKEATANSLLMFVAATCVVLIVKAVPQSRPTTQTAAGSSAADTDSATAAMQDGVTVYYMHGNARCPTCRRIEAYAREAVQSGFAEELKNRKIRWQVVNYEAAGNEHYAKDYELVAPNVVLVKLVGGKQVAWKGLPEVWEHVGDKAAFVTFVQQGLREFLQDDGAATPSAKVPTLAPVDSSTGSLPIPE